MSIPRPTPAATAHLRARRGARAAAGVLAATALLAGCGLFGSDDSTSPPSPTSTSTSTTTAPPVARSTPPELLDAGDEPRQPLRIAYQEGDQAEITFTSDLAITQTSDGRTQRLDSPPIAQTLAYTVGRVSDAGAEVTIRIDAIAARGKGTGLDEDELAAIDDELAPLVGLEATGTVTRLGELEDLAFDLPEDLPEALTEQLDTLEAQLPALGPALPSEPVGVGASWRTTTTTPSAGGAEVETVSTITVTAIGDGAIEYTSTISTSAEPQDIALSGLAEGTTARLESSDLQGSATGTMGLDRVAMTLRTRLSGSQQILLTSGGKATDLTQALEIAYVASTARD